MITEEDRAVPGIDMRCTSNKVDELVGGSRRLTVTLQGEYTDELLKDGVLERLKQNTRFYAGEFTGAVIAAYCRSQQRDRDELGQTKQQLAALTQSAQAMKQQLDTDTVKYQMQAQSDIAIKNLESKTQIQIQQMKDATQIEVARITAAKEAMIAEREAAEEAIALRTKIAADAFEADKGRAHEVATTALDHGATLTQQHQVHEQAIAQSAQDNQNALDQADAQRQAAEAAQPSPQADGAGE